MPTLRILLFLSQIAMLLDLDLLSAKLQSSIVLRGNNPIPVEVDDVGDDAFSLGSSAKEIGEDELEEELAVGSDNDSNKSTSTAADFLVSKSTPSKTKKREKEDRHKKEDESNKEAKRLKTTGVEKQLPAVEKQLPEPEAAVEDDDDPDMKLVDEILSREQENTTNQYFYEL